MDRDLDRLAHMRIRVALALTAAMLVCYFGFILLVAFKKPTLGATLTPGLSLGIALGAGVIVVAWVLTGIYVRWADRVWDIEVEKLRLAHGARPEVPVMETELSEKIEIPTAAATEGAS